MSTTANWSYTNVATVWPLEGEADAWTDQEKTYGTPYTIACTWVTGAGRTASGDRTMDNNGVEFTPSCSYYHEDPRPKYGDWIVRGNGADRLLGEMIKSHAEYDMSFFGEFPDYMSIV